AIAKTHLARLEHLDIVGRREAAGPEEGKKVVEAKRRILRALIRGRQRPRIHLHVVGCHGMKSANRDRHDVVDDQVRKDSKVPAGLADAPGALLAEAIFESAPERLE